MITLVSSIEKLDEAAQEVLLYAQDYKIFLFFGDMGAGKTTLIKAICHSLGVNSAVSSPTFSLVNEYEYPGGLVYHFDCYRLKTPTEALDFGIEEYLSSNSYCFIQAIKQFFFRINNFNLVGNAMKNSFQIFQFPSKNFSNSLIAQTNSQYRFGSIIFLDNLF